MSPADALVAGTAGNLLVEVLPPQLGDTVKPRVESPRPRSPLAREQASSPTTFHCAGYGRQLSMPMKSSRERAEEKREAKLESVREQVENGTLVIRQMTDQEREENPPRPPRPKRPSRW